MPVLPLASTSWQFRDATRRSPWRTAVVPGCVHRDLLRHALLPDPFWGANETALQWVGERDWEYRAAFKVSPGLLAEDVVDLVCDGLDTVATVTLNGHEVARTDNMFLGYRWDVKPHLRVGKNELLIRFASAMSYINSVRPEHQPREINDPVGRCTVIRKQQCQFGWDWGPRLITAGIWRDLRLEAWTGNRLESVRIAQHHHADGSVTLEFTPELARPDDEVRLQGTLYLDNREIAKIEDRSEAAGRQPARSKIENPQLWWPNGHGAQPLYDVHLAVTRPDGTLLGTWARRIGLRTIALDRQADEWGESFRFVVNGRPVFAKGANWIPAHSFVAGLTRQDYARDLRAAAQAHMNMIRVWGGGIYENEHFYDLCDELGLLVWQDFMFACTLYPGDAAFVASVGAEAGHQVRRLRHRACLALWCGNNEVYGCNVADFAPGSAVVANYEKVFHAALPAAVAAHDGVTAYWPGSPWRGTFDASHALGERRGDTHFWDVWHARHPVKDYEKWKFRFVSEFGMQSFSSPETQATFCPPEDANVFGPTMKEHQKNRAGNQIILDYVSREFRFPKDQDALIYLSQLNQALCMQTGVEHWRRNQPRCMGALYWQLNDCWPVSSWSSIEFTGRWKALHYVARRFFAPAIATAHVPGEETTHIGNTRVSTIREVHLYTSYDAPEPARGTLRWDLFHLDGRVLLKGKKTVALRYGESVNQQTLDLSPLIAKHTADAIYLRIALDIGGRRVSENTVFLAPPRYLHLPKPRTNVSIRLLSRTRAGLTFSSPVFQHRFAFDLPGIAHTSSDNYFDLYPGEKKTVSVDLARPVPAARLKRILTHRSLADSYD